MDAIRADAMKYTCAFLIGSATLVLVCSILYLLIPGIRSPLRAEDKLVENLSAGLYLLTALTAAIILVCGNRRRRVLYLLLILGSVCFLEELSFGQRLIGYSVPYVVGVSMDSLHDIVEVGATLFRLAGPPAVAAAVCVAVTVGAAAFVYRKRLAGLFLLALESPVYGALMIFAALIGLSLALDVKVVRFRGRKFVEEIIELNAALALLFACVCVYLFPRDRGGRELREDRPDS